MLIFGGPLTRRGPGSAALCALSLLSAVNAQATNGYFSHGFGTVSKGLAGAGSALPQDAMASVVNPAAIALVGERLDLGAALFAPTRSYAQRASSSIMDPAVPPLPVGSGPDLTGRVESENDLFLIPHLAFAADAGERGAWGMSLHGNGGMNTHYAAKDTSYGAGTFGDGTDAGVDLMQLFASVRYGYRVSEDLTLGAGVIAAAQRFRAVGLSNLGMLVADGNPDALSDNGYDLSYGVGYQLGALWQLSDRWTVAAGYQSHFSMSEFDDYADLFAERGRFDIPAMVTLGAAVSVTPSVSLVFDAQHIAYADVPSLGNAMSENVAACFGGVVASCLGGPEGAGFGWDDMTVLKFGLQWEVSDAWIVRGGYSVSDNPVPTSGVLFNVLAPAVVEEHFTLGLTRRLGSKHELNASLMYAPENAMNCGCTLPMTGGPESINIAMEQWEFELSYAWRW